MFGMTWKRLRGLLERPESVRHSLALFGDTVRSPALAQDLGKVEHEARPSDRGGTEAA